MTRAELIGIIATIAAFVAVALAIGTDEGFHCSYSMSDPGLKQRLTPIEQEQCAQLLRRDAAASQQP